MMEEDFEVKERYSKYLNFAAMQNVAFLSDDTLDVSVITREPRHHQKSNLYHFPQYFS